MLIRQDWYYSEIDAAVKMGLVAGYPDKSFKPNNVISRQDMAVITYEAIKSKGIFSNPVNLDFTDKNAIQNYALDAIQRLVSLGILHGNDDNTFAPLANTTRGQTAIVIKGMLNLKKPPVVDESYKVVEFNQDGTTKELKSFADFNTAKSNVANNQAVMQGNSIVYIKSGMAVSNSFTVIYNDANFVGSGRTYVNTGTEFQYLDAGTDWVKISIANKEGYVKTANVNLIPNQLIADRSSYKNVKGELYFTIYNPIKKTSASILVGKAPSFMVEGQKYNSWDGGVFYNNAGQKVGQAYQYFNYLPARTISNYTAEELNRYIDTRLAELESLYQSNPTLYARYQDAAELSKIKGLGNDLKEAESKYKINALLILSMAIHESDYGMSIYAQERNNLFGLNAVDSDEDQADWFATPNEAIDGLATFYLNLNYIPPYEKLADGKILGNYANGAVLGNKALGFNVKYASDPYWGQKIAGHMYRVDKFLGSKDFGKYRIGITNTTGLNVRHEPQVSSSTLQFTYKNAGMPVAILESSKQANGSVWYKVLSDHNDHNEAYIRSDFVDDMNLVK